MAEIVSSLSFAFPLNLPAFLCPLLSLSLSLSLSPPFIFLLAFAHPPLLYYFSLTLSLLHSFLSSCLSSSLLSSSFPPAFCFFLSPFPHLSSTLHLTFSISLPHYPFLLFSNFLYLSFFLSLFESYSFSSSLTFFPSLYSLLSIN